VAADAGRLEVGGFRSADGGFRSADGGFRSADGGFRLADGGFRLEDGVVRRAEYGDAATNAARVAALMGREVVRWRG
jgi:hypothetical protein